MRFLAGYGVLLLALYACGGDSKQQLVRIDDVAPGAQCASGGVRISTGADENGDGVLEDSEVTDSRSVCNGTDATSTLIRTLDEPPGPNCPFGGVAIQTGADDNHDGVLDASEVDATSYLCESRSTISAVVPEPTGTHCANGGLALKTGVDIDADGVLDDAEVTNTSYVCNGSDAVQMAVNVRPEANGPHCIFGGTAIETGVDDNRDGVLQTPEVDATTYACNGAPGSDSLIETTQEPAGPHCAAGGTAVTIGVDADDDDTLESSEVTSVAYVCNGSLSRPVSYLQTLVQSPPESNRTIGRWVDVAGDRMVVTSGTTAGQASPPVFVFERDPVSKEWALSSTITVPTQVPFDNAGEKAVVRDDLIAITARNHSQTLGSGVVYLYVRNAQNGQWELQQTLASGNGDPQFGYDVAIGDGFVAAISQYNLFVFRQNATTHVWELFQTIPRRPNGGGFDSVAAAGTTIAAGGYYTGSPQHGVVWVYELVPQTGLWTFSQDVAPSVCCPNALRPFPSFGLVMRMVGNRIAVADYNDDAFTTGTTFVFDRVPGQGWVQHGMFTVSEYPGYRIGSYALALHGNRIAVSKPTGELGDATGRLYLFEDDSVSGWHLVERLQSPDKIGDAFGLLGVALDDEQLFSAAPQRTVNGLPNAGAVHVYAVH